MTNGLIGKAKQAVKTSGRDVAKKTARKIIEETQELGKSAQKQVLGGSGVDQSSLVREIVKDGEISQEEKLAIQKQTIQRLEELEAELAKWRKERKEKDEEWKREQVKLMQKPEDEEKIISISPTSKKGHFLPGVRKSKGSGELIKTGK
ncbi:hypothetical protein A2686_01595 [Candidatus Woesebacteria bacterium RIFCSPHIGHO2_01_FULL_38_10]|uniref:Uncharacterized protein n=1 Tax=Candidatus Woesebacteria bacterium RIFCSPLOWO2_01_FULL_39_10b TaxID=1802517 RepID=A0A1F8B7B8_9BACT|nr:MAG: hypothetical protein A2686_01595 [Candidatus Woesebacteria bacterium RIFCSPHIGHO2_01_FULL_38_10]OGM59589.1 MAG: hypothetical protein A2892_04560 [Candidatus Woesebacteria bacterium RIFCSPLOWO2_01_FULL_39_10b]